MSKRIKHPKNEIECTEDYENEYEVKCDKCKCKNICLWEH